MFSETMQTFPCTAETHVAPTCLRELHQKPVDIIVQVLAGHSNPAHLHLLQHVRDPANHLPLNGDSQRCS